MRALIIGDAERAVIKMAIELARARPVKWDDVKHIAIAEPKREIKLSDRTGYVEPGRAQHLILPDGYHCAFSFEEQPLGLFRHLSVSVPGSGVTPSVPAVEMIAKEFGVKMPNPDRVWLEEYRPGHYAVNVLHLETTA